MSVRIGINPLTWSNDDLPSLGGDTPLEVCLREACEAGYAGIELGNKFPREAGVLRPLLERHHLALVSGWYGSRLLERSVEDEIAALAAHRDLLRAMGCAVMVFAEVSGCVHGRRDVALSRRPVLDAAALRRLATGLTAVARHLGDHGIRLAYHHHVGTVIETAEEVDRLMAATGDEVGLLLDTGHLRLGGGEPAATAERHAARVVHVHCKDVRTPVMAAMCARDASFLDGVLDGVFAVPGDGDIDFAAVLRPLARAGYAGWLVVEAEQDPARAHPLTHARMGFRHLSSVATAVGLAPAGVFGPPEDAR